MSHEESKAEEYPLARVTSEKINRIAYQGWDIVFVNEGGIAKSAECAKVQQYLRGAQSIPDMLFARNRLYLVHKASDFIYSFNPLDAVQLCLIELQRERLLSTMLEASAPATESQADTLSSVSLVPPPIEVQGSGLWKGKDTSKIEDFKNLEKTFDWSFSTPYKGSAHLLSQESTAIDKHEVQLDGLVTAKPSGWRLRLDHESEEQIPLEMLGPHNPILHYGEVTLYEDELGDKGYTKVNVRFRVMADCWFVLFRSYTRVDHVLVRILDTRLFCRIPQ